MSVSSGGCSALWPEMLDSRRDRNGTVSRRCADVDGELAKTIGSPCTSTDRRETDVHPCDVSCDESNGYDPTHGSRIARI